ncbi:MAG: copper amine oxidase N-terminal domain-containing protein [Clostridiales bacterium]|jgi:hypothetical protein|nr:copper amine oxidase N-terminal domain-containing protein [Clostridiales bacterium]
MKKFHLFSFISLFLFAFILITSNVLADEANSGGELNPDISEYQKAIDDFLKEYDLDITITIPKDFSGDLPPIELYIENLKNDLSIQGYIKGKEKENLIEASGYDYRIVTFDENAELSVFVDGKKINFEGNMPYAIRVRNHDEAMLPLEELSSKLGMTLTRSDDTWTIEYGDFKAEADFEKDQLLIAGEYPQPLSELLKIKDDNLYANTNFFKTTGIYTPSHISVIYHNLNKIELLSAGSDGIGAYTEAQFKMSLQYDRVDYPITHVNILIASQENNLQGINLTEINLTENEPLVISNTERDNILIPLREFENLMGLGVEWDGNKKEATVTNGDSIFTVNVQDGFVLQNDERINITEAYPPVLQNGRIYLDYYYIGKINNLIGTFSYQSQDLYFSEMQPH